MRPRPLKQDSAVIRATGFADLEISAGQVFKQAFEAPTVGNLLYHKYKTTNDQYNNQTEEEKNNFFDQQEDFFNRKHQLQSELDQETDPIKRDRLLDEMDELQKNKNVQRDFQTQKMIDDGRLLTVDALNDEYGDLYTFEKPQSREVAEMLVKNKREELIRNAILEKGLDDVSGYTALISGALLAAATDPVEVAAAAIPYFGPARRAATIARFGKVKGRTTIGAAEGLAGSLVTEPLYYGLSQQLQLDYSMGEALLNVGVGTFLGGGIGTIAGVTARRINIKEVARDSGVPDDIFPEQQRISEADAVAETQRRNKNTYKNNGVFGGQRIGNVVLRQFVNDNEIDVSPVMPRYAKRPQNLIEFIKDRGGINDDKGQFKGELSKKGIKARTGYVTKKGSRVSYLSNKNSELDLVEATEIAFDGGYLGNNQVDEFLQRIDEDLNGDYTFSLADQEQADLWRKYHQGKNDFEKETEARNLIRQQVKDTTGRDLTDTEVAILSDEINRTGVDLEDAAKSVQIKLDDFQAQILARNGQSIANDVGADVNSAERFDELLPQVQDEFEFDAELEQNEAIIRQYEENGDLDAEDLRELEEIRRMEEKAEAYQELTRVAAICTARA